MNEDNARHSFAHVLAGAVKRLYPEARFGIGPVIQDGFYYDFDSVAIAQKDLPRIEQEMRKIIKEGHAFKKELWDKVKARRYFKNAPYKLDLLAELPKSVGIVHMGNAFTDLCRGGHIKNTSDLAKDAFKLTSVAGAYWRGREDNPQLTRVYGAAFHTKRELDAYLKTKEEAEKRDHRRLGKQLGLFVFSDLVGPGLPLYTPKGTEILERIRGYSRELRAQTGYQEVATPQINKAELFRRSGHYDKYKGDMFQVKSNYTPEEYFLKPMNCPQHTQLYAAQLRSYKDLPVRYADFSMLYRDEKPGELMGLLRLRAFSQDDGHCFCREDQVKEEFGAVLKSVKKALAAYKLKAAVRLSLRDKKEKAKYLGDDATWNRAEKTLKDLLKAEKMTYSEAPGEAAFYGPKMDILAEDSLGREHQLSTIQLDLNIPNRFSLTYVDEKGERRTPILIHSALVGSSERFLGTLLEHYAGAFPLWLAPEQVWILPITSRQNARAASSAKELREEGFTVAVRDEKETLGYKIREGEKQKIPYLLVIGEKEQKSGKVRVRKRGAGDVGAFTVKNLAKRLKEERDTKA